MCSIPIEHTDHITAASLFRQATGAKKVLGEKGYSYTEINIEQEGISRKQLQEITGRMEVPAIIIDGVNIGGLDNLIKRI